MSYPNFFRIITPAPFILFPSAITNSLAVMLLPTVAQAQAEGNKKRIQDTISMSLRYSLYMGILCIGIFTLFGTSLGVTVFHNLAAGNFITTLAWLCPFMYLATTLGSILNGLGKTTLTFYHNAASLLIRLCFVVFLIPRYGILAYLWGMLLSELTLALFHYIALYHHTKFSLPSTQTLVKPTLCLLLSAGILRLTAPALTHLSFLSPILLLGFQIGILCLSYGMLLLLFHKKEA